jgi:hypothetical protein
MKAITAFFILVWCFLTFIPAIFLLCDLLANGRDSVLVELAETAMQ